MKVQRVVINETCNQNCWFCSTRREAERADFASPRAVFQRISEALSTGPEEIVLTGGEPLLRGDLDELVRHASSGGAIAVIETNATLVDRQRARALAKAGLRRARVQLLTWGSGADDISRTAGGFAAARSGIESLVAEGLEVEITTPVVRRNLDHLTTLVAKIFAEEVPTKRLILIIPTRAPDDSDCASPEEVARAVAAVAEEGRRVGLIVQLDNGSYVPPCIFDRPGRVAHLYALNRGNATRRGFRRISECQPCLINDRCPGVPDAWLDQSARPKFRPRVVDEDRLRRRLTVVSSVPEQVAREVITRERARVGDDLVTEHTIRVNFHCNQACEFCFVSTHLPPPEEQTVRSLITAGAAEQATIVLSGGEPTLNPRLADYIALAKRAGAPVIELQTNAIKLSNPALVELLVQAGLDRVMVSLHGSNADLSDRITGAPGTFVETLAGLDQLARSALEVRVNFVFCQMNRDDFPHLVALVADRWPQFAITVSFVGSHTDVVPRSKRLVARFSELMPALIDGLEHARAAGIDVRGFESMCGLPLCLVPERARAAFSVQSPQSGDGGGEFVKSEACRGCREDRRCYGLRRGYAELYGTGELAAL